MKAKSFEEWNEGSDLPEGWHNWSTAKKWNYIWLEARVGMIPEDEAVRTPPVEVWPEWSKGICYQYAFLGQKTNNLEWKPLKYIPRPAPAWTPKVGDAVFAYNGGLPWIAVVEKMDGDMPTVRCSDGDRSAWPLANLKPFDATKIGCKWEEI